MLAAQTAELLTLAHSRAPADRERLLAGIVNLCNAAQGDDGALPRDASQLVESVFVAIVEQAERDIRRSLAEKLSEASWPPPGLINMLALDEIEIAQPIITYSPVLQEADLMRILVEATVDHQIAVARRPGLTAGLVQAILDAGDAHVLTALASNDTADISEAALAALIDQARRVVAMRSPLARHPRLSSELALRLYAWVGESLKLALASRFRLDPAVLDEAVAEATRAAVGAEGVDAKPGVTEERDDMDRNLVEKLHAAGELRPGYLLRALREGRLNLFVRILSGLGGFESEHVRRAIDSDRPELLGLACASVGVDRGAFPTILALVRELNQQRPAGGAEGASRAIGAFGPFSRDIAKSSFNQAILRVT